MSATTRLASDPVDILLDSTGDIDMSAGGPQFSSGVPGVVQHVRIRLLLIRGEWYLNLLAGTPWRDILGHKYNQQIVYDAIRETILGTPGIIAINQLDLEFDGSSRTLTITWQATCAFGDTPPDILTLGAP